MDKVWNDDHIQRAGLPVCLGGAMSGVHWEAQSKHKGDKLWDYDFFFNSS